MNWKTISKPTGHGENKTSVLPEIKQCIITFKDDYCLIKVSERIVIMADARYNKVTVFKDQNVINNYEYGAIFPVNDLFNIVKKAVKDAETLKTFAHE